MINTMHNLLLIILLIFPPALLYLAIGWCLNHALFDKKDRSFLFLLVYPIVLLLVVLLLAGTVIYDLIETRKHNRQSGH